MSTESARNTGGFSDIFNELSCNMISRGFRKATGLSSPRVIILVRLQLKLKSFHHTLPGHIIFNCANWPPCDINWRLFNKCQALKINLKQLATKNSKHPVRQHSQPWDVNNREEKRGYLIRKDSRHTIRRFPVTPKRRLTKTVDKTLIPLIPCYR